MRELSRRRIWVCFFSGVACAGLLAALPFDSNDRARDILESALVAYAVQTQSVKCSGVIERFRNEAPIDTAEFRFRRGPNGAVWEWVQDGSIYGRAEIDGQRWSVTRPVDSEPTFAKLSPDGQVSDQTARLFEPRFDFDRFGLSATIDGEPEWMPDFLEGSLSLRTTATHFVVSSDTAEHTRTWAVSRDRGTIDRIETTDGEHTVLVENSFDENGAPVHSQTWVNGRITQEIRYNEFIAGDAMTDGGIVTPADVGVVTGTIVDLCFGDQIDRTIRYWHAERQELLDEDAMWTLYRLGLAAPDPALASQIGVAESARRQFDEHAPYRLSYWKQFTLRYCELYRFDDEQRQKAFTICEGAEEQGRRILTECRGQTGEARQACAERFRRVFDDRLVAGLDRLRTLRQRRIGAAIED